MGKKRVKNNTKRLSLTKQPKQATKVAKMNRVAAGSGDIDIEEILKSNVISTNDGTIRTRNGLKCGNQIQRTFNREHTKASNVLSGSESTGDKASQEKPIMTRIMRVRSRQSPKKPIVGSNYSIPLGDASKVTGQMIVVLNKIDNPVPNIPVLKETPHDTGLNVDIKPEIVSPVSQKENISKVDSQSPLSTSAVEERLKSPQRRYLLKQLESSLSPKYMELTKTTVGHAISRYGRIQKQKEDSDYIPLELARFITKSPAKIRTVKKELETVPLIEYVIPSLIDETEHASTESLQLDVINGTNLTESPVESMVQLNSCEISSPVKNSSEPESCIDDKSDIPFIDPNASLLGIDEIQIVDLDASFGENAIAESPANVQIKEELAKSPAKSSEVDSAEGSSFSSTLSTDYQTGQILWGAFNNKLVHWPCIVIPDPENGLLIKPNNAKKGFLVHVNFFADNGRRAWIPGNLILPFSTLEDYKTLVESQFKALRLKLKSQCQRPTWLEAIQQADDMEKIPIETRKTRFQELLEIESAKSKQLLRKRAKSLSTGYHSNSFDESSEFGRKRQRSPTPESPAYEALPIASKSSANLSKRMKLEPDDRDLFRSTISRYFQSMTDGSGDFLETASGTSSESDDISEMMEFDKEIYNNFLNMSRLYVFEGQTETEVDRKLQKYVQKICALRMQSIANGARISNRLRTQALKKLGRELGIDKVNKDASPLTPLQATASSSMAAERPKKKVQRTLDDLFIFNLERNYLMKGVSRGFVCTVCLKPNDLVKCSKCCNHYHAGCSIGPSREASSIETKTFICLDCIQHKPAVCFVCHDQEDSVKEEHKYRCTVGGCGKNYHVPCLRLFPQHKFTGTSQSSTLFCPYHTCHTCVSDDPRTNATSTKGQLVRCIKCPSSYHTEAKCIPAGSQILSWAAMICPKHNLEQSSLNVNWCFLCCKGGSLICCETCPTAFHLDCLKFTPPEGKYICEECESGRMPLYNEIVWAKYSHFRFWPAMTVPPPMVPDNLKQLPHEKWDICVRFFGTHDHVWINRRRIYLYQEGDSDISEKKGGNMAKRYNSALQDAKTVHGMLQARKAAEQLKDVGEGTFKPPMYVKIKSNRYVAPLKAPSQAKDEVEDNACECNPNDDDPCGPETNCINRALLVECNPKVCPARERCLNQCFEKKQYPALAAKRISQKGWGLVTLEDIRQGQFVIEYVGEVINNEELARRLQHKVQQKDENYYFLTVDSELTIDAGPKGNLARFINHSCEPNCETMLWRVGGAQAVGLFAIKDLKAGDELTFNYNFESKGDQKKICHCNASKCSGYIGQKYRPPPVRLTIGGSKAQNAVKKGKSTKKRRQSSLATMLGARRKSTVEVPKKVAKGRKSISAPGVSPASPDDTTTVESLPNESENRSDTVFEVAKKESNEVATEGNQ